jgi:hypothetical protein
MATVYKQIQQGDSLTFGMIFQGGYDTTRIQHLQLHLHDLLVGDLEDATIVKEGIIYKAFLTSEQTYALTRGLKKVTVTLDDSVWGVIKSSPTYVEILTSLSDYADDSKNTGYNIELLLTVTEGQVITETKLIDAFKGRDAYSPIVQGGTWWVWNDDDQEYVDTEVHAQGIPGVQPIIGENGNWYIWDDTEYVDTGVVAEGKDGAAATIAVGDVTTLDAGEDATVENVGTPGAAVFNFGIPKGPKGDTGGSTLNTPPNVVAMAAYDVDLEAGEDFSKTCGADSAFTISNLILRKPFRMFLTGGTLASTLFTGYTANWILGCSVADYNNAVTNVLWCEVRSAGQIYLFWGA